MLLLSSEQLSVQSFALFYSLPSHRMFTSRAEFRLHLRPDNADSRLTPLGHEAGCVTQKRFHEFTRQSMILSEAEATLKDFRRTLGAWKDRLPWLNVRPNHPKLGNIKSAWDIMKRNEIVTWEKLTPGLEDNERSDLDHRLSSCHCGPLRLQIACMYEDFLAKQLDEMNRVIADERLELPETLDYASATGLKGLSAGMVEKLEAAKPATLGAASRIQGITPSALVLIMNHAKKMRTNVACAE